jgi:sugar-specific transcriptional regulator TrmB
MKEILKQLDMTHNEVEIYLVLLKNGSLNVGDIGKKAGLHRTVCYDSLERLIEKGFISVMIIDSKKYFKSLDVENLQIYINEKKENLEKIMPQLKEFQEKKQEPMNINLIKGKNVLKTVLNDIIKTLRQTGKTLYVMGVDEEKYLEYDELTIKKYIKTMQRENLKEKLLTKKSAKTFFKGKQSIYKAVEDNLFNPNPTHIYGNKMAILVWGNPMEAIIIENKEIVDANKKYFKILWKQAEKIEK